MNVVKSCFFCVLAFLCLGQPFPVKAQQKPVNFKLFFEKVYLHTDRDVYTQGDTVWFKAYLVNGQTNAPIGTSGNLYVELINVDSTKISGREIIRLENGLGNGDFSLSDSIPPGKYILRAYTNWMRNFGDNLIFEKDIAVYNTSASVKSAAEIPATAKPSGKNIAINTVASLPPVNVTFYPEGGSLVEGINSLVAVKAEDAGGRGLALNGSVLNSARDTVSRFSCDSLGMGRFALLPMAGQKYIAIYIHNRYNYSVPLPQALIKGMAMRIASTDSVITALIISNDTSQHRLILTGKHAGKAYFNQNITLTDGQALLKIPENLLPEGIAAITLYDEQNKPNCERLVYVHHQNNATLGTTTDKAVYQPKGKTTVKLKLSDITQRASLSVAVVDEGVVPMQSGNIASYLLLTSEIKGNIEHAEMYFDTNNTNRFKQLDLLLMTQGWRDFLWRRIADSAIRISYNAENGINIDGQVKNEKSDRPLPGLNITLYASAARGGKLFSATTDSLGHFSIRGLQYFGDHSVKLSATDTKGEKRGVFFMDTISALQMKSLAKQAMKDTMPALTPAIIKRSEALKAINFKGTNQLKEVKITNRKTTILSNLSAATFGYPDQVFDITKQDEHYQALDNWLAHHIKGAVINDQPGVLFFGEGYVPNLDSERVGKLMYPRLIVNGREIVPQFGTYELDPARRVYLKISNDDLHTQQNIMRPYFDLPINKVKKVIFKHLVGADPDQGKPIDVYLLYLTIADDALAAYNPGIIETKVNGYYNARAFYKPAYDKPKELNKPDLRTTIHWEPNVKTDKNGEATFSYYNADPKTKVRIVVEGITNTGQSLVSTIVYYIK